MEGKQRRGELAPEDTEGCEPEGTDATSKPRHGASGMAAPPSGKRGPSTTAQGPSGARTGREFGDTGEGKGWMPPASDSPDDAE